MEDNIEHIKNSLKMIPKIFDGFEEYRIIGSILVAAINKEPHRLLHDVDLLVDESIYEELSGRFKKMGFKKITKHAPGFKWDEFEKEDHLTFGVLLKGTFEKDHFEYRPNKFAALYIDNTYLTPTYYELYGVKMRGIPLRSVYEGIKIASLNTKRGIDKEIVKRKIGSKLPEGFTLNQAFRVNFIGLDIPYFYTFFSQMYNLLGGARILIGKSYDPWH